MTASRPSPAQTLLLHPAARPLARLACALPIASLLWGALTDRLGPNPAEVLIRGTGDWTMYMLWMTLAVTPLRQDTGWHALARFRRTIGQLA